MFKADKGAGAIRDLIVRTVDLEKLGDELQIEVQTTQGQRRKKATKRLRVVENFRKSGNKPEWMIRPCCRLSRPICAQWCSWMAGALRLAT